jgi:hypothetical protein
MRSRNDMLDRVKLLSRKALAAVSPGPLIATAAAFDEEWCRGRLSACFTPAEVERILLVCRRLAVGPGLASGRRAERA